MNEGSDQKERYLKDYFSWNPHAETVQDELFQSSAFFDPRDVVLVKYEMLRRVRIDGLSVVKAAAAFGFSRSAFYTAREAWDEAGMVGLLPSRPGPRGGHKLTDQVMQFIEDVVAQEQRVSTANLVQLIDNEFHVQVHPRSIERARERRKKGDG